MDIASERLESLRVADVMNRSVVSVFRGDVLFHARALFLERGISAAPVVDEDRRCVGMVSLRHLVADPVEIGPLHQGGEVASMEKFEQGPQHFEPESRSRGPHADSTRTVAEVMNHGVQTVAPEVTVIAAAKIMCMQHTHRLVVLDHDGRPIGIVSSMDIVATVVNAMEEMRRVQHSDDVPD